MYQQIYAASLYTSDNEKLNKGNVMYNSDENDVEADLQIENTAL